MKRVLLTGATGFIGRHCLPLLLANGFEVDGVSSRIVTDTIAPEVSWHQADLLDPRQVTNLLEKIKPTHLLHFAWYAVPGKYWTSIENLRWVQASLNLFQSFAICGGERVVGAGSCAEYDWQDGYCAEKSSPLKPATLYGASKHALQVMLDAFAQQIGISAGWGRSFFLYGPHEYPNRLVPSVVQSILKGEPARCSHGNQVRDFLYVKDVAAAFVKLLESEVTGAVNIASGHGVTLKEIIETIAQNLRRQDLVKLDALPAAVNEPPALLADVARLRDEVGWSPRYDLTGGLAETINWWKLQQEGAS
jgi:nucleoside-diphosphate-sugar epimerase